MVPRMVGMLGLAFIVSFRSLTRFSVPLIPRPRKDGIPTFVGPDAPPGRAAFAAQPPGGDAAAGGVAAPAIPALGRAPATGVGCRTGRRGGYATAGRAARAAPAARRERWAGFPPGRASGPAPSVQVAHQRVASRTRRNGGAVVSLRSLRRSDAALARLRKLRRARWRPLSWLPAFAAPPAVPRAGEPASAVRAVRGGALRAPPVRFDQCVRSRGATRSWYPSIASMRDAIR